ncbi:GNAT family N-acetyltransferase [Streptomyces sp. SCSIO 30461]|uniref:GNAT family N-acetyltransferase n=1 Tax=Streptomyces sp. SCSIO 30461 TaxID=3118085 RepID=UPI0030CD2447
MTTWSMRAERFDTADATALRRDYYAEVAGRYWRRPATTAEVAEGLTGDGVERLDAPTGAFVVGRHAERAGACGGVLLLDTDTAELTRVYIRPGLRGTGGGALLLGTLEDAARRLGAKRMVLNTRQDLIEARTLYSRNGYVAIPAYCQGPYMDVWCGKDL